MGYTGEQIQKNGLFTMVNGPLSYHKFINACSVRSARYGRYSWPYS